MSQNCKIMHFHSLMLDLLLNATGDYERQVRIESFRAADSIAIEYLFAVFENIQSSSEMEDFVGILSDAFPEFADISHDKIIDWLQSIKNEFEKFDIEQTKSSESDSPPKQISFNFSDKSPFNKPLEKAERPINGRRHHDIKTKIMEKYCYVTDGSPTKDFRPLLPKEQPKKLVRYRDGKIVNLKGEKYTEIGGNGSDKSKKLLL